VVLLERDELTSGSTWHAAANIHGLHDSTNISRIQHYTMSLYKELEAETGQGCGVFQPGSLYLAQTEAREHQLRLQAAKARLYGMNFHEVGRDEAERLHPLVDFDGIRCIMWEPDGGNVDPSGVTNAYAAYGIGVSLVSFSIVVGFGFGIAAATLVGQQLGAGRPDLAEAAGWRSLRLALLAMGSMAALQVYYARDLAGFMIDDPQVIDLTVAFIYLLAASQPMMACELTLAGALRGAGDTRFPLFSTFCGMILGRLLPAWLFLQMGMSVYWIYAVMLADYSIKACLLLNRYRSRKWLGAAGTIDSDRKNT